MTLEAIEMELRSSASDGAFRRTPEWLRLYNEELARVVRQLAPGSPELRQLEVHVASLMRWLHLMASASRAHCTSELERLKAISIFLASDHPRPITDVEV